MRYILTLLAFLIYAALPAQDFYFVADCQVQIEKSGYELTFPDFCYIEYTVYDTYITRYDYDAGVQSDYMVYETYVEEWDDGYRAYSYLAGDITTTAVRNFVVVTTPEGGVDFILDVRLEAGDFDYVPIYWKMTNDSCSN